MPADIVMWIAVGMSVLSFLIYLVDAWSRYTAVREGKTRLGQANLGAPSETLGNAAKLAEALAKLTDSLTKAGPGLIDLIASVLFLADCRLPGHSESPPERDLGTVAGSNPNTNAALVSRG
jgi:hypothetical protein